MGYSVTKDTSYNHLVSRCILETGGGHLSEEEFHVRATASGAQLCHNIDEELSQGELEMINNERSPASQSRQGR